MRVLVIGGSGMLGSDVVRRFSENHEVVSPSSKELDITDPMSVANLTTEKFDWCVNCAAYTAVDKAETERQRATELNSIGPGYLATTLAAIGTKLIHVSTDFVFDGKAHAPYAEDAPTRPLGHYGQTKREGEIAVLEGNTNSLIVRTSWLYGPNGPCFPRSIIRAFESGKPLRVVSDQVGCPTYTADLAEILLALMEANAFPGIYHAVGLETMSWYEFAKMILKTWAGPDAADVEPIRTSDWPTPAKRPAYSALGMMKLNELGIAPMRSTPVALMEYCERLVESTP